MVRPEGLYHKLAGGTDNVTEPGIVAPHLHDGGRAGLAILPGVMPMEIYQKTDDAWSRTKYKRMQLREWRFSLRTL